MPSVYIAGPMRGYPKFNFPAFDEARDRAKALGWTVISPADLDRDNDVHEDTVIEFTSATARVFATRDIGALLSFKAEEGDAIALLPGWDKSTGARAEFFLAKWVGLQILDATTMEPFPTAVCTLEAQLCRS